jgi:3-(3-hydroxy-phenyl)propionate hydroxylase
MVKPENLWPLLARWIRPEHADIERAVIYTFHSIIAEGWRKGRLMLAGDSAHQTPPFLGQGMCAGLRDVFNLAWKLDAVIRSQASPDLLDTYESERSPHVDAFIALAVRLGDIIQTTDPQAAQERDRKFKAGQPEIFSFPSPRLGPGVLTGSHPMVGQPMTQPVLDSGQLLDEVLGQNFAIIASPELLRQVSDSTRNAWADAGIQVLPAHDKALAEWLQAQQLLAVALRPDRYIQAVANTPGELAALSWPQA